MSAELRSIEQKLAHSIDWNQARIKFLARFLVALISVKTVCLKQIASVFPAEAKTESSYKRIQRFLRGFDLDYAALARLMVALIGAQGPWTLALDRTNWKLGKTEINILMLCLVPRGVGFPLLWTVLGKAGNSNSKERIELLERFVALFGKEKIACLCADREFASLELLSWLGAQPISYRLRLKGNTLVANRRGQRVRADGLFRRCPYQQEQALSGLRACLGQRVYVTGTRLEGDYLIVISDVAAPLSQYALRWGIETLFGCLKSRGFCLEATHVTAQERLSKLLAVLSLAFCWAFAAGVWLSAQKPLKVKKHGRRAGYVTDCVAAIRGWMGILSRGQQDSPTQSIT